MNEIRIGKKYTEEKIGKIISKEENTKIIYTSKPDSFMWGKEEIKVKEIIKGYEEIQGRINNNKEITYIIVDIIKNEEC